MAKVQELQHVSLATTYEIDNSFDSDRFIKLRLRVSHDGENLNKSSFELSGIEDAKESIKNIPLLANVIFDEDSQPQFSGHDMHIEDDKVNEGKQRLIYDEIPIGVIPESCNYEIKEFNGKNYAFCDCYCWKNYSNYAQDIIERDENVKLSMEILVDEYNFNAKKKCYNITKYRHTGITLLNKNFGTGMENALATTNTTSNFSEDNSNTKLQFIQMMEELKETLVLYNSNNESNESNKNNEEGGIDTVAKRTKVFEEVVEPIVEVVETIESTETVEIVEEVIETEIIETEQVEEEVETTEIIDTVEETVEVETIESTEEFSKDKSIESTEETKSDKFVKSFELSHDDVRYGLYQLIAPQESEDEDYYYIDTVYDNKFEYQTYSESKIYRQSYSKNGDSLSLVGEKKELFQERLTLDEKEDLDKKRNEMSANYEALKAEFESLNSYKLDKEREEKAKVFSKFEGLTEEDIKDIKENIDTYSLAILEEKLLLVWAKKKMEFEKIKKESGNTDENVKDKLIFALANTSNVSGNQSNAPIYADILSKYNR